MNQLAILLVCAVLAAAGSLATCNMCLYSQYVDWTKLSDGYEPHNKLTRDAILEIKIDENDDMDATLNKIKTRQGHSTPPEHAVYNDLIALASSDQSNSIRLLPRVLEIFSILCDFSDEKYEELKKFVPFFRSHGRQMFDGPCREAAMKNLIDGDFASSEERLDQFVAALNPMELKDAEKYRPFVVALAVDLAKSENLKVHNAIKVAKSFGFSGKSLEVFRTFWLDTCSEFQEGHLDDLNIVALSYAFGHSPDHGDAKILKLQEYQRLCLSWKLPDKREAIECSLTKKFKRPKHGVQGLVNKIKSGFGTN